MSDYESTFVLAERQESGRVNLAGNLVKGAIRQALAAEIADEGFKVLGAEAIRLSNGDVVAYTPPPPKLAMPDMSEIKSIRHYFGKMGFRPYPAFLFHKDGREMMVSDAKMAGEYGIVYRETTQDERNRYGVRHMWDWEAECFWRPTPWTEPKFDPKNPGAGKNLIWSAPDPKIAQNDMIAEMIPQVAAAVAAALKASGPAAPTNVSASDWDDFLAFKAWKEAQKVVTEVVEETIDQTMAEDDEPEAQSAMPEEMEKNIWRGQAERLGIEIDGRWSLKRLKAEVEKAEAAKG